MSQEDFPDPEAGFVVTHLHPRPGRAFDRSRPDHNPAERALIRPARPGPPVRSARPAGALGPGPPVGARAVVGRARLAVEWGVAGQARVRKNSLMSAVRRSGASRAAKWPPRSNSDH